MRPRSGQGPRRRGGFSYHVTMEQIRAWQAVPAQRKLRWLDEANRFLDKAMTPEAKRARELFGQGKLGRGDPAD